MLLRRRSTPFLICAAAVLLTSPAGGAEGELPPAAQPPSAWDVSSSVSASAGRRNNVTVSAFTPIDRAFGRVQAELLLFRPIGEQGRFIGFIDGDVLRYQSPPAGVSGEEQWIASMEGRWQPTASFRGSLRVVGFAQSTFIDPSVSEGSQEPPLWVRIRGGYSTAAFRIALPGRFVLEPSFQAKVARYTNYPGDYDETRPGLRILWIRSPRLELSAAYLQSARDYRSLSQSTASNRPLPGTRLSLHQREAELKAVTSFEAHGSWTLTTTLGRLQNRDRARGFLDYDQDRARAEIRIERGDWTFTGGADARRIEYLVQRVGSGLVSERPPRITDAYAFELRIEKTISERWSVFADERWERNRSNVVDDDGARPFDYRVNTASVGVKRTF